MCNSILCHIIKLPHICLYPDDSARQLFFFCTTFHILREIFLFVKVFLSFFIWILHEFILFFYIDFVIFFIIQFLYLHCQKSFCFYIAVSATLFVFWRIYSFTMVGSCSIAGMIFSIRSFVRSQRLDVLMHGWHPIYSPVSTSSSIRSRTILSLSFISPSTLKDPGVMSRYFSIYSAFAKESLDEPICADRFFVLNTLSPGSISK